METPEYSDQGFKLEFKKDGLRPTPLVNNEMYSEEDGLDFTGNYRFICLTPAWAASTSK